MRHEVKNVYFGFQRKKTKPLKLGSVFEAYAHSYKTYCIDVMVQIFSAPR